MKISKILKSLTAFSALTVTAVPLTACTVNGGGSEVTNNPDNQNPETETPDTESPDEIDPEGETPDGQNKVKYCKIKFSSEGFPTGTTMSGSTTTSVRNGKYFSTVKKPTVTCPAGWKLSGWSETAPGGESPQTKVKDNDKIESDKTLYGVFEQVTTTHTVTLFAGDGYFTGNKKIITVTVNDKDTLKDIFEYPEANEKIALPSLKDTEDGQFDKWVTADGSTEFASDTEITEDVALCAKYTTTLWAPIRTDEYSGSVGIINSSTTESADIYISAQPTQKIMYQLDSSNGWEYLPTTTGSLSIEPGHYIHLRSESTGTAVNKTIKITGGSCNINGNVLGLLDIGAGSSETTMGSSCFQNLFKASTGIVKVHKDFLPADTLMNYCYREMFSGCTSLITAPALPATTLKKYCYERMFYNCSSLTEVNGYEIKEDWFKNMNFWNNNKTYTFASGWCTGMFGGDLDSNGNPLGPYDIYLNSKGLSCPFTLPTTDEYQTLDEYCFSGLNGYYSMIDFKTEEEAKNYLPWKKLAPYCFSYMFTGCISLSTAPALPAETLCESCYEHMFYNCTSLTNTLLISATSLAESCCAQMFYNCTSLTTAPELQSEVLAISCYEEMFYNCTSLTTAPELPATTLAGCCYKSMFSGCTSLTTAPALPATNLLQSCYQSMFSGCTSLTVAPSLSATKHLEYNSESGMYEEKEGLAEYCYRNMFYRCTSLTTAPALPATTLATYCYASMFQECTSLSTAPTISATSLASCCCSDMFYDCTSLQTAPTLSSTTLASNCYYSMFSGCTSLTTAPKLPATTLATYCYTSMFSGCTSLTTAPALPAETLYESCYSDMFKKCTSLSTAPTISATSLAKECCQFMFQNCTSLTTAPALPATTLAESCYNRMFNECRNLTVAPELPATILAVSCYENMFSGCTSLITAPALPATTLASYCYYSMFSGCTSLTKLTFASGKKCFLHATPNCSCCYMNMFYGCSAFKVNTTSGTKILTTINSTSSTTLYNYYGYLFSGCQGYTKSTVPSGNTTYYYT